MRLAMPADAPEIQVREMRNAFYAGVCMIFAEIMDQLDNPKLTEEDGGKFLSEIHSEVNEFMARKMVEGLLANDEP
jgi:hypothetical protein